MRSFEVHVWPLFDDGGTSVTFSDVSSEAALRAELDRPKQEVETAYEERQSSNEELETTNEERQSSNEELETTNEELESTNAELQGINTGLQQRTTAPRAAAQKRWSRLRSASRSQLGSSAP